mmetsp:Transcript_14369/g.43395  ORF Transcript_14369/g.43395 Transcript_14369/m.43395 type:complete len:221 (-) Transcript_14369:3774-4436(-)
MTNTAAAIANVLTTAAAADILTANLGIASVTRAAAAANVTAATANPPHLLGMLRMQQVPGQSQTRGRQQLLQIFHHLRPTTLAMQQGRKIKAARGIVTANAAAAVAAETAEGLARKLPREVVKRTRKSVVRRRVTGTEIVTATGAERQAGSERGSAAVAETGVAAKRPGGRPRGKVMQLRTPGTGTVGVSEDPRRSVKGRVIGIEAWTEVAAPTGRPVAT